MKKKFFPMHILTWHKLKHCFLFCCCCVCFFFFYMHKDKQRLKGCCEWSVAHWVICMCRYEGHDYTSKLAPLLLCKCSSTVKAHYQLRKAGEWVPNLYCHLCQFTATCRFYFCDNWSHSIPHRLETIYSKSTILFHLPTLNWN